MKALQQIIVPILILASSVLLCSAEDGDASLYVAVIRVENPTGSDSTGAACSPFDFIYAQCSMKLKFCVGFECTPTDFGQVTTNQNSADLDPSLTVQTSTVPDGTFLGFNVTVELSTFDDREIMTWTSFTASDGSTTFGVVNLGDSPMSPSVRIAFKTTAMLATTPAASTEAAFTGSTTEPPTTTTPLQAKDCEDYPEEEREDGVKVIYIGGSPVNVDCKYGTTGSLTTIQSRDISDVTTLFNRSRDDYKVAFGTPGKNQNFWLGLDNMNLLTTDDQTYTLQIDLCCNGQVQQQFYTNITIGSDTTNYTLNGNAVQQTGLNLPNQDLIATDLGSQFNTYDTFNPDNMELCPVLQYYGSGYNAIYNNTQGGGWWFGSCSNNLNGQFVDQGSLNATCGVTDLSQGPGLEMRTTTGSLAGLYIDGVSYTRVRMAVYRADIPPTGIDPADYCT